MITTDRFCSFAYGSNMCSFRLKLRVPSADSFAIGFLKRHSLHWHKRSNDGSGKCDAEITTSESDIVWGVLYKIKQSEKRCLDEAEGLGSGYAEKEVDIVTEQGVVRALMYYATKKDSSLRPYHWYKAFVVAGAREHGLPEHYLRILETVQSIEDPDSKRSDRNERVLFRR